MRTIETKGGQIFEILTNVKEAVAMALDNEIEMWKNDSLDDDYTLYIEYKDGSYFYLSADNVEGKFKKTGITKMIESNPCTTAIYGNYRIYNIDDTNEEYSIDTDDEYKGWNIE